MPENKKFQKADGGKTPKNASEATVSKEEKCKTYLCSWWNVFRVMCQRDSRVYVCSFFGIAQAFVVGGLFVADMQSSPVPFCVPVDLLLLLTGVRNGIWLTRDGFFCCEMNFTMSIAVNGGNTAAGAKPSLRWGKGAKGGGSKPPPYDWLPHRSR